MKDLEIFYSTKHVNIVIPYCNASQKYNHLRDMTKVNS